MNNKSDRKKVIVIGGGISGMTSAIYLLDNGYDVELYEKHSITGGECTSWKRSGVEIDGCAHWIIGVNKYSNFYPIWNHLGAIDENTKIHLTDYFTKIYYPDGEVVTVYADLKKFEEELLRVAPEDKKMIKKVIRGIKGYQHVDVPTKKPLRHYNLFELIHFGLKFVPMLPYYLKYKHMDGKEFCEYFKSEKLRYLFKNVLKSNYNVHSFFYIMQGLSLGDSGVIEGGSLEFARRIENTFVSKGGKLFTSSEIDKIIVENNTVKGIKLKNGEEKLADYVVGACDAHHMLYDLLDNKYTEKFYQERFDDRKRYPLNAGAVISFKVTKDISDYPRMMAFAVDDLNFGPQPIKRLSFRNHSYTKKTPDEPTTVTSLISTYDELYDYLKALSKEDYNKEKTEFGLKVLEYVKRQYNLTDDDVKLIDVTTPLTYERYLNAYRGSYQSFITTKNGHGLMRTGVIKGLKNFIMAGQWLMAPGGLPIAVFTGKHAAYEICKWDHKKFKNLEKKFPHMSIRKRRKQKIEF